MPKSETFDMATARATKAPVWLPSDLPKAFWKADSSTPIMARPATVPMRADGRLSTIGTAAPARRPKTAKSPPLTTVAA